MKTSASHVGTILFLIAPGVALLWTGGIESLLFVKIVGRSSQLLS